MINIELLSTICKTPGAPGFEHAIRSFLVHELEPFADRIELDSMGNIIAFCKGKSSLKKLMFSAHMDEISFIVSHIDEEGFVRFLPLGGFDPKTLTAQRVIIHGKKDIIGVMGSKPIHLMSTKSELIEHIEIGNSITRERELIQMGQCINAKSLDNRISVYCLLEAFKLIHNQRPEVDVYAVFTVQEEIGLRGAKTAAHYIAPDYAINVDTTIAFDVPGAQAHEVITKLGQGVAIKIMDSSVICDYRMVKFIKEQATLANIVWQAELLPAGGTDTASVQTAGNGAITGALSIPTRHIHQVIEMVHQKDVMETIKLIQILASSIHQFNWTF
jgi:endoglucanase